MSNLSAAVLFVSLVAAGPESADPESKQDSAGIAISATPQQLQQQFRAALQSNVKNPIDESSIERLIAAWRAIDAQSEMSRRTKARARQRLVQRLRSAKRAARRQLSLEGGTNARTQALIDLIQTTIKPDSWSQTGNGGGAIAALNGTNGGSAANGQSSINGLIDLIHSIDPPTWDINGGLGTIRLCP